MNLRTKASQRLLLRGNPEQVPLSANHSVRRPDLREETTAALATTIIQAIAHAQCAMEIAALNAI
jgi:hypothetical protein